MKNDNYIMLPNGVIITRKEYRESYARQQQWAMLGQILGIAHSFLKVFNLSNYIRL